MCDVSIVMAKNSGVYTTLLSIANDNLDEMLTYDVPRTFSEVSYFEQGTGYVNMRKCVQSFRTKSWIVKRDYAMSYEHMVILVPMPNI